MAPTKSDIISKISSEIGLTNIQSIEAVENDIKKNSQKGRNIASGNDMMLPVRKVVNFKCSGKLRDRIMGKNS